MSDSGHLQSQKTLHLIQLINRIHLTAGCVTNKKKGNKVIIIKVFGKRGEGMENGSSIRITTARTWCFISQYPHARGAILPAIIERVFRFLYFPRFKRQVESYSHRHLPPLHLPTSCLESADR